MGKIADLQEVPINKLRPYTNNAKQHSEAQVEQLKNSMREFGFITPCVIDADFNIIAGHGRIMAATALGMTKVPCIFVEGLTDEQRRAYILADNRLTELGEWDRLLLSAELNQLKDDGFNIDITGFTIDDIMIEEIDFTEIDDAWSDAAEPDDDTPEPQAKRGDLYRLGDHFLLCGDATNAADVDRLLNGAKVQLIVTDPPYNVSYGQNDGHPMRIEEQKVRKWRKDGKIVQNDDMDDQAFYNFLFASFTNMFKALDPGRSFYIWHANMESVNFMTAAAAAGLEVKQILIWVKNHFVLNRQDYKWRHEPCLYGWREGAAHYFIDQHNITTVLDKKMQIDDMTGDDAKALLKRILDNTTAIYEPKPMNSELHPTMKPINLIKKLIENSSKPGEKVLDLFGGSGTTLIASEQTERVCYMMELDPAYIDAIIKRFETVTGKKAELISEG